MLKMQCPIANPLPSGIVYIAETRRDRMSQERQTNQPKCSLCHDTGWLLEAKDRGGKVTLEVIPCLIPDCEKSGQRVELMSVNDMQFSKATMHPNGKLVMSLSV